MLVLSRKVNQRIVIEAGGEHIEVFVADIKRDKVRIAIDASRTVTINRREVWERIKAGEPRMEPAV